MIQFGFSAKCSPTLCQPFPLNTCPILTEVLLVRFLGLQKQKRYRYHLLLQYF